ncbi:uncharacterized protein LOC123889424 [Trifolium pratense]|uniref:Uncharacterized protein n=1 Tax=Trifolium pratense TaxID=57577 RepID=A0ACB0JPH7_TRIPR|nr:uncharacterized protein LOC123889424 [Trifolium pratense]CAJ2645676.1 unnamed protein product [Trifolium pratense]
MEGGFIHCQKKCSKLTWCYFNVKGATPHQWRLPLTVYQPSGKKNKRSNQRRSKGELLVLLFSSKFLIPSVSNVSQKKILNDCKLCVSASSGSVDVIVQASFQGAYIKHDPTATTNAARVTPPTAAPAITAVLVFEDVVQAFKGRPQSAELFAKLSSGIKLGLKFGTGPDKR